VSTIDIENMEGYKKVIKAKPQTEENEIRVTLKGEIKKYLGYALRVLTKTDMNSLKIISTGNAMLKGLMLIEIVKRRVGGLYQINKIDSYEIDVEYEPELEGLPKITQKRRVVYFECNLYKYLQFNSYEVGYQEPDERDDISWNDIKGSFLDVRLGKESEDE
jgi:ribonucleases P/MRP protein subunit RPP25